MEEQKIRCEFVGIGEDGKVGVHEDVAVDGSGSVMLDGG